MSEGRSALRGRMERLLGEWRSSGQSLSAFARARGISRDKLEYWKRRLDPGESQAELVPVRVLTAGPDAGAPIEIALTSGDRMLVHEGTSPRLLRDVIAALRPGC